jgi:rhamnulokinase
MTSYLSLDLGAESGRAIVGTVADGKLSLSETHRFANRPLNLADGLHWDASSLWRDIKTGITVSAGRFPLESLGLDTWGVDFALLGRDGELLANPYHYRDSRTDGMLEEAFKRVPREQIFAQTGIQFMQINTLYQLLAMTLANSPILESASTLLTIPDLFNYWLSGQKVSEFTIATTTQCFDPRQRDWARGLLEELGIPTQILPPVCEPGTVLGTLLLAVAKETGARRLKVIAPACHDTGSAVAAVPAENEDFAWISSGTWSILGAEVRQPNLSAGALASNFTNEGGVFGTWRLSKNITGLWFVQECKRQWQLSYDKITCLAEQARPFLAVIDPDSDLFLHPGDMPEKIRSFCKNTQQGVPATQGEIVRVALESLALKYRFVLMKLEELVGKRLEPLHILGGGTRNGLLNQLTADATQRTVVTGPVEATAIGNILMQAVAVGQLASLEEARSLVRRSFAPQIYQPRASAGWDGAFNVLLRVMKDEFSSICL